MIDTWSQKDLLWNKAYEKNRTYKNINFFFSIGHENVLIIS